MPEFQTLEAVSMDYLTSQEIADSLPASVAIPETGAAIALTPTPLCLDLENLLIAPLTNLGMPRSAQAVLRSLVRLSNGDKRFRASFKEIALLQFGSAENIGNAKRRVRYQLTELEDWQRASNISLVRRDLVGHKLYEGDKTIFEKSIFQWQGLNEFVYAVHQNDLDRVQAALTRLEVDARSHQYQPSANIRIRNQRQRDVRTLETKFLKGVRGAIEAGNDPVDYVSAQLEDLHTLASDLISKHQREQRTISFLADFDSALSSSAERRLSEHGGGTILSTYNHAGINFRIDPGIAYLNPRTDGWEMKDWALHYAELGIPVIPLHEPDLVRGGCTCGFRGDCTRVGKHPRTWFGASEATTNMEKIASWWDKWPTANIGIATGAKSGFFVVDIDPKSGGYISLERLMDLYREELDEGYRDPNETLRSFTGSRGTHYFFSYNGKYAINGSASIVAPGIDIRSDGNYVVAAPSMHSSGRRYHWHGIRTVIQDPPDWMLYEILKHKKPELLNTFGSSAAIGLTGKLILEGGRNDFLYQQSSGLIMTYSLDETLSRVLAKNASRCVPPLPVAEVTRLVNSATRYRKVGSHYDIIV